MGIVNRRNAVVGWIVLKLGKRAAKKKAQGAVPGALAAIAGTLFFWRKKRDSTGE
ncbi:MAG TPA: hypothetical protein VIL98_15925 [Gaiellaceae bacterium]|jgi:hypothetical protein